MKKFILIMTVLIAAQTTNLMAQTDEDFVYFTAVLNDVFNIAVTTGNDQTATFTDANDYNVGVIPVSGVSTITVESTGNWDINISGPDFTDAGGTNSIPINNLGVWCEATGVHQFGTEVTCAFTSLATSMGITIADQILIDLNGGNENAGTALDNAFNLNWSMGTMQGTMNGASMLSQVADGTIGATGTTYTTTLTLTLTGQ